MQCRTSAALHSFVGLNHVLSRRMRGEEEDSNSSATQHVSTRLTITRFAWSSTGNWSFNYDYKEVLACSKLLVCVVVRQDNPRLAHSL